MKNKIERMIELIDETNTLVHPQWREQNFNFALAVIRECMELMDHYGWEWWKPQHTDRKQVELELVDIFVFGASFEMQRLSNKDIISVINSGLEWASNGAR